VSRGPLRVTISDGRGRPVRVPGLAHWLSRAAPARARGDVAVALVGDRQIRGLNRRYLGRDRVTDVLSFPAGPGTSASGPGPKGFGRSRPRGQGPRPLGDIVISRPVAARQARAAGHPLGTELRVLALHGLLHLLGYDHERDGGSMARLERRLRRKGGLQEGLIERGVRRPARLAPVARQSRVAGRRS
jgi:probable rRNA maturation factor